MNRDPQEEIEEIEEEATADYVNVPACTVEKVAARPDQRFRCFSQSFPLIAVCWLILLVIMGLRIYFATLSHGSDVSELMAANRNLTNLNDKLSVLENQITDLTAVNQELETRNQELETLNQELETLNQDLETERKNSRGQIQNISRAQWSIDQYCPEVKNVSERRCQPCQKGWRLFKSSCYLTNNDRSDQKTWEESREDCRGRSSDLVVVHSRGEQNVLHRYSGRSWIGLRAEGGRWKWINGSDLTESYWIPTPPTPATDGQCVVSSQDNKQKTYSWTSESCAERRRWICKKKALSV